MSYNDDGSEYTRGVGAVASLDDGITTSGEGGAATLPRAMAATRSTNISARRFPLPANLPPRAAVIPTKGGPVIVVPQKRVPPPVFGKNVPYPVTKYQQQPRKMGSAVSFMNPAHAPTPATGSAEAVMMQVSGFDEIPKVYLIGGAIIGGFLLWRMLK